MSPATPPNEESVEAWNNVLFDKFSRFRDVILAGLTPHSERALSTHPPGPGDRVLDIGCGFGDTTQRLAGLVGPDGSAVGVDGAQRFVEVATREAEEAGVGNVRYMAGDAQTAELGDSYDYVFGRCGTMFFADPAAALRNVREAMVPGGRLCHVVWRRKLDNPWAHRAELAVAPFLEEPEQPDEPPAGPGPFSMADADVTTDVLTRAGFENIALQRSDQEFLIGHDMEQAVALLTELGPVGAVIREWGDEAERIRPELTAAIEAAMREFERSDGVYATSSTWVVSATAPDRYARSTSNVITPA